MLEINLRGALRPDAESPTNHHYKDAEYRNVSSVTGLRAFPGVLAYCVSKAGLIN